MIQTSRRKKALPGANIESGRAGSPVHGRSPSPSNTARSLNPDPWDHGSDHRCGRQRQRWQRHGRCVRADNDAGLDLLNPGGVAPPAWRAPGPDAGHGAVPKNVNAFKDRQQVSRCQRHGQRRGPAGRCADGWGPSGFQHSAKQATDPLGLVDSRDQHLARPEMARPTFAAWVEQISTICAVLAAPPKTPSQGSSRKNLQTIYTPLTDH